MKTIVTFLLLGCISKAFGGGNCPHPTFVAKHICNGCANVAQALEFSRNVRCVPSKGGYLCEYPANTVQKTCSYGDDQPEEGDICRTNVAAQTWQCEYLSDPKQGYCLDLGMCFSKHSLEKNGHLDIKQLYGPGCNH